MSLRTTTAMPSQGRTAEEFWEALYQGASPRSTGRPSAALVRYCTDLAPGRALDLGCGRGDDSVWLAQRGWATTAVDVAPTALRFAADNAERAGVPGRIVFERHDLDQTFPNGAFDLVIALFLHSPIAFARDRALQRAARAVALDGALLIVEHASRAPWSWSPPETTYPAPEETISALQLPATGWSRDVGAEERIATGPGGQRALVKDNVLLLRRRS